MQDRGAQLQGVRIGAKCLRNVKRVSQLELAWIVSTMVLERQRGNVYRVNEHVWGGHER